jgi:Fe-Mn family superoxide dismutase
MHFKLYRGYVKETNSLLERISQILTDGKITQEKEMLLCAQLKRRLGFERNAMVLHEYYFGNLKKGGSEELDSSSPFSKAVAASFGDYHRWKADFAGLGNYPHWKADFTGAEKARGAGWAICYQDPATDRLANRWIELHELGSVAGYHPVLVMDMWEHAFILDDKPAQRAKYIEAFFSNIDWKAVDQRLLKPKVETLEPRALISVRQPFSSLIRTPRPSPRLST